MVTWVKAFGGVVGAGAGAGSSGAAKLGFNLSLGYPRNQ